jgi:hypothetical protein
MRALLPEGPSTPLPDIHLQDIPLRDIHIMLPDIPLQDITISNREMTHCI